MSNLLLVDGTNLIMRYAHAMMPKGGVQAAENGEYGWVVSSTLGAAEKAIRDCARQVGAEHAVVALDTGKSWRRAHYAEYKATRTVSTVWWSAAFASRLAARKVRVATAPNFEADDIIATIAHRERARGGLVTILSGDSDLLALAKSMEVMVYQFGGAGEPRFVWRDDAWISQKFRVLWPADVSKYKAIVGEPGDNLPGVQGLGPVAARKVFAGTLVLTEDQQAQYDRMLMLTTLRTDAPVPFITLSECRLEAA